MTCKICGKQLPEGSTTCKYCGARVKRGSTASNPASGTRKRYSKKGLARRRIINLVILILALAIVAAVIAGIVWSANRIGDSAKNDASATSEPQTPETPEEPESPADEAPIIPEEEQEEEPEQPAEQPEETPTEEEPSEEMPVEETPAEETPAAEEPAAEEPAAPQPATDGYTISLNRTETTASLNHYRELEYYLNQELPDGVTVASTSWTSSNDAVVRAEEGRAWGVSLGEATVTVTVTLSNGHTMSATCQVDVVESQIVTYSEYVLSESNTRYYTADELKNLTADELFIARNEIYARHGRTFTNPELQQYFNGKSWYSGTISPENFDTSVLNSFERANVSTILAVEASR